MVTGSCYMLTGAKNTKILIDFGMFQGPKEIHELNHTPIDFDPGELSGAVLTHAHLDHCGRLPLLVQKGFRGKIFMTKATQDLTELVLFDSAKIAKYDKEHSPLYSGPDVERLLSKTQTVNYHTKFKIGEFTIEMYDAGHLLGSTSLVITDGKNKMVFSGDLGNSPQKLVRPTEKISKANFVVMETTYGGREHPKENAQKLLQTEINIAEKTNATLLIPSFAMNRTQDLLHRIKLLKKNSLVDQNTPVFLDSPMAISATQIHKKHKKLFNKKLLNESKGGDPFNFPGLFIIDDARQSKNIKKRQGTKVIIAGSGMMNGGRILNHAATYLPQAKNRLLFIGFQAEETIGRDIKEGAKNVKMYGERVRINANISTIDSMSSHAGQSALLNWLKHIKGTQKVFLTHGEENSRQLFSKKIKKNTNIENIFLPKLNEELFLQ